MEISTILKDNDLSSKLIAQINKDMETDISISKEGVFPSLEDIKDELVYNLQTPNARQRLYKVDLDENKVQEAVMNSPTPLQDIAIMVVHRVAQKIVLKHQTSQK